MTAALLLLLALLLPHRCWAQDSKDQAPSFSSDSIVNSANGSSTSLTPGVIASLYGERLAFSTEEVSLAQVGAGTLPTVLAGVRITVGGRFASLLYVSPKQINFLIPSDQQTGHASLILQRQATSVQTQITLVDAAPGLYVVDQARLAATHANGKLITPDNPALADEVIVVYGTGLGRTDPKQLEGMIPRAAAAAIVMDRLRVSLDEQALPAASVLYAGITPGFPGLYQINLRLPVVILKSRPEFRVSVGEQISQSSLLLEVAATEP